LSRAGTRIGGVDRALRTAIDARERLAPRVNSYFQIIMMD
jgi:hypothetical protein